MKNGKYIEDGVERWYKDDEYHRLDGPAVIHSDGSEGWYKNGKRHRLNGPAVTYFNGSGSEYWYIDGIEIIPEANLIEIPITEEEKLKVINQIKFIEINKKYVIINEWLKRDERFYNKYKLLFN